MKRTLALIFFTLVGAWATASPGAEEQDLVLGRKIVVPSRVLGVDREILVSLPTAYDETSDAYAVLYVLDGEWHFLQAVSAVRMLAEMSYVSFHALPPLIVVGVVNDDRNRDYTPTRAPAQHGMQFPTSGGADAFLDFLRDELIPAIDARYRTHPYRVLAGWSLGGLATTYAFLERPDIFNAHLAISPSLWWDDESIPRRVAAGDIAPGDLARDIVMTIGSDEAGGLCYNAVHGLVDALAEAPIPGFAPTLVEIPGETHNSGPLKAYYEGLRTLFGDWTPPDAVITAGLDTTEAYYARLSAKYRRRIDVPAAVYSALGRYLLGEGRPEQAVAAVRRLTEREPESALAQFNLGEFCRRAEQPDAARRAYRRALDLESRQDPPDPVFVEYVEGLLSDLATTGD